MSENKIKYEEISHKKVFTAADKAATLKIKPAKVGKTLILKSEKNFFAVLIAANRNLNKEAFKKILNIQKKKNGEKTAKKIDFASELLIKKNMKGAKIGVIPPFGSIWKIPTFIDKNLLKERSIFVNSGDYFLSLNISPKIFQKIQNCFFGNFSKSK